MYTIVYIYIIFMFTCISYIYWNIIQIYFHIPHSCPRQGSGSFSLGFPILRVCFMSGDDEPAAFWGCEPISDSVRPLWNRWGWNRKPKLLGTCRKWKGCFFHPTICLFTRKWWVSNLSILEKVIISFIPFPRRIPDRGNIRGLSIASISWESLG